MNDRLHDVAVLQTEYRKLQREGRLTKQNLCNLVIPFRDRYHLADSRAIMIARGEMSVRKMDELLKRKDD